MLNSIYFLLLYLVASLLSHFVFSVMGGESVARPSSRAKKAPATPTAPTANAKKKPTADATKRKGGKGDELENERIDCTTPENPSAEATGLSGEVIAPAETVVIDQDLADANRADFVLRDLTAEHIVQLEAINTPTREAICAFVTSTFSLHDAEVDLLKSILKDYYTNIIMFAKEKKWNGPQTAAFFSIMKAVLERSAAKDLSVDQSLALFRTYITKHCIGKDGIPPLYSALQTRQIVDFSVEWLYQHYELYKYCFTVPQETHIYSIELPQIETPVNPPALGLALSEEKFKQKIETEKIRKEEAERLLREGPPSTEQSKDGELETSRSRDATSTTLADQEKKPSDPTSSKPGTGDLSLSQSARGKLRPGKK